jgi:formamidopyrimidine-DNA glycosylase
MPELPEVEVIVRHLQKKIINCTIKKIKVFYEPIVQNISNFNQILNKTFLTIRRKGKYLIFYLSDDWVLVGHLRMEGKIYLKDKKKCQEKEKHEYFRLILDNDMVLQYYDFRKFGRFLVFKKNNYLKESKLERLALDPFLIKNTNFYHKLQKTHVAIKTVLLNQQIISGIGNIYANEILFAAKIHPETKSAYLTRDQTQLILKKSKTILKESISLGGTTVSTFEALGRTGYFQHKLLIHGKDKQNCIICQNKIQKIKIGGRGSYFCAHCQKSDYLK